MKAFPGRLAHWVGATVVLAAVLVGVRIVATSRAELSSGKQALEAGDERDAIVHFRRALQWYLPWSPYPQTALEQLHSIASQAEAKEETERALAAWRAIHGGLTSARSLWVPYAHERDEADARIVVLMARQRLAEPARAHDDEKTTHIGVHGLALIATLLGFSVWVWALVRLSRVSDETGMGTQAATFSWRAAAAVALVVFMLGLWFG